MKTRLINGDTMSVELANRYCVTAKCGDKWMNIGFELIRIDDKDYMGVSDPEHFDWIGPHGTRTSISPDELAALRTLIEQMFSEGEPPLYWVIGDDNKE